MEPTTTLQHIQTRTSLAQPDRSAFWTFQTVLWLATPNKVVGIFNDAAEMISASSRSVQWKRSSSALTFVSPMIDEHVSADKARTNTSYRRLTHACQNWALMHVWTDLDVTSATSWQPIAHQMMYARNQYCNNQKLHKMSGNEFQTTIQT